MYLGVLNSYQETYFLNTHSYNLLWGIICVSGFKQHEYNELTYVIIVRRYMLTIIMMLCPECKRYIRYVVTVMWKYPYILQSYNKPRIWRIRSVTPFFRLSVSNFRKLLKLNVIEHIKRKRLFEHKYSIYRSRRCHFTVLDEALVT